MVNEHAPQWETAQAELKRRGTVIPTVEISGHAIDRASCKCWTVWRDDRIDEEGLHAWLVRITNEALLSGETDGDKIVWKGMKLVIEKGYLCPILKTIMKVSD